MRKLDDIIPPSRRKEFEMPGAPQRPPAPTEPTRPSETTRSTFPYRTALVALLIVGGVGAALFYFSSAKVEVTPASSSLTVAGSFTALAGVGDLPFEVVTAEKVAVQSVPGSGTKTVNQPASGTITIYNTQSKSQTLVANTRFAAKGSGLVFRIRTGVTVPKGTESAPGSVRATVYADQPGDIYNIGPTSFTLPGLSGSPQFSQVTAISSGPMSGGASGTIPVVAAAAETTARTSLVTALTPDLHAALKAAVPPGYVLLAGAATTTFTSESSAPSAATGMVDIKEKGTISAVVFPAEALAGAIAKQSLGGNYTGAPMTFVTNDQLKLTSATTPSPDIKTYLFSLSGATTLAYTIDSGRIAAAIAGKTREEAKVIITNYPEIKKAILILRPFWRQHLPEDPASISVVVGKPE